MNGGQAGHAALRASLQARGLWNSDGIYRRATARYCPACGVVVMRGLDDARAAMTATADLAPLSPLGEVAALFAGLHTYSLTRIGNRYVLDHRDVEQIAASPAGTKQTRYDVLAEHKCGRVLDPLLSAVSNIASIEPKGKTDDGPPF